MEKNIKDQAVIDTLIDRMANQRLPRLLEIKKNVDEGQTLSNMDIEFMEQAFKDARQNEHYIQTAAKDDDLKEIIQKIAGLYKEITDKALENEKQSGDPNSQFL